METDIERKDETGMELKYCLSDRQEFVMGRAVRRIFALRDFADVREGDMGGYVESEDNLSQEGDCWIYDDAMAVDYSQVSDNARLKHNAVAQDHSRVQGNAVAGDDSTVADQAIVKGNAWLFGSAAVCMEAVVMGNAKIGGLAVITGMSVVDGDSIVTGLTTVAGNTYLVGDASGREDGKMARTRVPEALPGKTLEAWLDPEDLTPRFSMEGVGRDMDLDEVKNKAWEMADLLDARTLRLAARFASTVMQKTLYELRSERRKKVRD